jgi:predicted nuclease of restriction endonuclease-like (RecB) superfamily
MNEQLQNNYLELVQQLKQEILSARIQASLASNVQLLTLYWKLGTAILERQKNEGWGAKVIDRLSADLKRDFPDMEGLSIRNLKYMRAFAEAYPLFLQQLAAKNAQLSVDKNGKCVCATGGCTNSVGA